MKALEAAFLREKVLNGHVVNREEALTLYQRSTLTELERKMQSKSLFSTRSLMNVLSSRNCTSTPAVLQAFSTEMLEAAVLPR